MPKPPAIELNLATLLAYLEGQLSAAEILAVETALGQDQDARDILEKLRQCPIGFLREASSSELAQTLPPDVVEWIRQGRAEASPTWRPPIPIDISADQELYNRERLLEYKPTTNDVRALEADLGGQLGVGLRIPDLASFDLSFKRGRLLLAEGNPFAELVYLPAKGPPVVLCLFPTDEAGHSLTSEQAEGVNLLYWSSDGAGYAIISKADRGLLKDVASYLASQRKDPSCT